MKKIVAIILFILNIIFYINEYFKYKYDTYSLNSILFNVSFG